MSIQVRSADFRRAVSIASKVVERHNTIPILETLRMRANGVFEVTGTDLDMTLSASVPREPGKDACFAMMSPGQVRQALKYGGGDTIRMTPDKERHVEFVSGALSLKVGTLPPDDFPNDAERPQDVSFTATLSPDHIRLLDRVAGSVSKEETRYYLNGVYMHRVEGTTFRLAATDGHRLSQIDIKLPDASGDFAGIIIPNKAVGIMRDLAAKASGDVKLSLGTVAPANREESTAPARAALPRLTLSFEALGATIAMQTKLIDGTFPDYSRVVPQNNDKSMLFDPNDLRKALRAVSGHSKKIRAIKLELLPEGARLSAAYVGMDLALAIELPCTHASPGFEIGFNGNYLLAIIDAAQGDELLLVASDPSGPVLVKNPADTAWTGVLMPMRF